jgi:SNF2 family DNA or RNA helicase
MDPDHQKLYDAVKDGVKEEVDKINLNSSNLLALTTRLRQATDCPEILTSQDIVSTKVTRCVELVEDLVANKEKVVVLSNFKSPVYKLAELLKDFKPLVCTGDQPDITVSENIDKFQNDNEHFVLLGTHPKMGTGVTLNRASYMICIDIP